MITGILLGAWLAIVHPKPLLLEVTIDSARLIGLPRLKRLDGTLNKMVAVNEMYSVPAYAVLNRKEFFIDYFKVNQSL